MHLCSARAEGASRPQRAKSTITPFHTERRQGSGGPQAEWNTARRRAGRASLGREAQPSERDRRSLRQRCDHGWPRRAEVLSRASRLAPRAERNALAHRRLGASDLSHLTRTCESLPRSRGASESAAAPRSLRRGATLCSVHVSEQMMAYCSELVSCSKLFSNSKNRSCKMQLFYPFVGT